MFTTAIIAFREFLEVFLIIGVFFGVSRKLQLKKELEISLAAAAGIVFSFLLISATYFFGGYARNILTEKNADTLEGYLMIFSGVFIAYVVFSLHKFIGKQRDETVMKAHKKLARKVFDISLFITIMFLVIREGFEIALFSATISLFTTFIQNIAGLFIGFIISGIVGIATFAAYMRLPIGKVFKITEYGIILVGASSLQNGVTKLFAAYSNINLSAMVPFHIRSLPDEDTFIGNFLQSLFGIDRQFSLIRLLIMVGYAGVVFVVFLRKKHAIKD